MRLLEQEKSTQVARQPLVTISSSNQDNMNTVKSQNLIPTRKQLLGPEQHCEYIIFDSEHLIVHVCLVSVIESLMCR